MNTQRSASSGPSLTKHDEIVAVEGLEDLFKWASSMMGDLEEGRAKQMRDQRMRRQVLEVVQRVREQEAIVKANEEIAYLQRRLIAILQKLQERTEEIVSLRQLVVSQCYALEEVPKLQAEIDRLKTMESHVEAYQKEQQELLTALSKLKKERDLIDDLLSANEQENDRLVRLLAAANIEITQLKARRWWHLFLRATCA